MAGGLFALLDDVAAFARIAAASVDDISAAAGRASAKAAGVVVDDTAVTPQYLAGTELSIGPLWRDVLAELPERQRRALTSPFGGLTVGIVDLSEVAS
jgi:hypothetical protein